MQLHLADGLFPPSSDISFHLAKKCAGDWGSSKKAPKTAIKYLRHVRGGIETLPSSLVTLGVKTRLDPSQQSLHKDDDQQVELERKQRVRPNEGRSEGGASLYKTAVV